MPRRTIVISGVTSGLGQALAAYFCASGHRVIGCGRRADQISALQQRYPQHSFVTLDITDDTAVARWVDQQRQTGPIADLLINNAGTINQPAPLWQIASEEFNQVLRTNVEGSANLIRHWLPLMLDQGHGVIVNFSSGWGRSTSAEVAPYCASKWAIEGLTQALAQELPPHLAAVAVNPGIIDTPMLHRCWGDGASSFSSPEQWVELAAPMLLSLGPRHNGQSLTIG